MEKTKIKINKLKQGLLHKEDDLIICEYPLTIFVNKVEFITLLCTPKNLIELTYGFLFSEGFINGKEDIDDYHIDEKKGTVYVSISKDLDLLKKLHGKRTRTTGCGKGTIFNHMLDSFKASKIETSFTISSQKIIDNSRDLNKKSELFLETGGVHSTMLMNQNEMIVFYEDVARHNTIDKIIGYALLNSIDLAETALFTSGRISSEMLLKTLKAKIPMIISRSAPTDLAVQLAREYNVSLIGFVRGERMNIYHDDNRIIID